MAFAELTDAETITVQTTWSEKDVLRKVPGSHWNAKAKVWEVPYSWAACVSMRGLLGQTLTIGPALDKHVWEDRQDRIERALVLRAQTALGPEYDEKYHGSLLFDFQRAGVEFLLTAGDAVLADDMGAGKTVQIATALQLEIDLWNENASPNGIDPVRNPLPAVVVCPNSVKYHWGREIANWTPGATPYVVAGPPAKKAKIVKEFEQDPDGVLIVNFESLYTFSRLAPYGSINLKACRACRKNGEEGLPASRCEVHPKLLNTMQIHTVIVDEIHRAKEPKSRQTRACWALMHGKSVTRRWGATGTPLVNHPGDTWSILHGVLPREFPSRVEFVERYCLGAWNPYGTLDIVGINPEHREEFFRIMDPHFRRMPKELVLPQLPPKVRSIRQVELSPKQLKAYREIETAMIAELGGDAGLLVAPSSLVQRTRLMQLASSMCEVDRQGSDSPKDWRVRLTFPSPKVDELEVILDEMGPERPIVVCAQSKQLINLASQRMTERGIKHGLITGDQNEWERQRALDDFQLGKTRLLLFTLATGGTGLTMTRADTIVFLQRSWSMVEIMQAENRVHRIGSERWHKSIHIIDVVAKDTVEETEQIPRLYMKLARMEELNRDRALLRQHGNDTSELDALEMKLMDDLMEGF